MNILTQEEINQRISEINLNIDSLNKEKAELNDRLIESAETFEEKFRIWWETDTKEDEDYLLDKETYPHTRAWFDDNYDLNRYQNYDVCEYLVDNLNFLLDPEEYAEYIAQNPRYALTKEAKEKLLKVAKEIFENNLGSFTCDW